MTKDEKRFLFRSLSSPFTRYDVETLLLARSLTLSPFSIERTTIIHNLFIIAFCAPRIIFYRLLRIDKGENVGNMP